MTIDEKLCPVCGHIKPIVGGFNRCRARKDGAQFACKSCQRDYQQAHKDHRRIIRHANYVDRREEILASQHTPAWRRKNAKACRKWRKIHRAQKNASSRLYYQKNRTRVLARQRAKRKQVCLST